MPRKCTICSHKSRAKIDQALVERQAFRHIAARFDVSTGALVKAQAATEAAHGHPLATETEISVWYGHEVPARQRN